MKLNTEQHKAVTHKDGPLLIFAGAGSGKTRVITNRIIHLIEKENVDASKIVALSFTNKSAKEMLSRVRAMIDRKKSKGIELSTFHSLGLKILKKYIDRLGYKKPFLLQAPFDLESGLNDILKSKKIDPKKFPPKQILSRISLIKNSSPGNQNKPLIEISEIDLIANTIFEDYIRYLKNLNSVDFDDLILLPVKLINENRDVQDYYRKKHKYFMIDEFQDTNQAQYRFIQALLGKNQNLCVVGDDDQSIYGFRGSDVNLILNFEKDFPGLKIVKLLQNYRSSQIILGAANSLIKNNPGRNAKELWSEVRYPNKVRYVERLDEKDEAVHVVDLIQNEIIREKVKGKEIAILFRTNYQSRAFEEELRMRSIPYRLIGGYNFFDRKEVRDLISYIRFIANPADESSLVRILNYPKRGLGETTISRLQEKSLELGLRLIDVLEKVCSENEFVPLLKKNSPAVIYEFLEVIEKYKKKFYSKEKMSVVMKELIKELQFEKEISMEETDEKVIKARMMNISEFVNMMSFFENGWEEAGKPTLFDFLARLTLLMSDDETTEEKEDSRVQLMTIHLSKGLEFDVVFVVGMEEGIIPTSRSSEDPVLVAEERRLLYVGMTRARKKLFLTGAQARKKYGEQIQSVPSRFLTEISNEFMESFPLADNQEEETEKFLSELEKLKVS